LQRYCHPAAIQPLQQSSMTALLACWQRFGELVAQQAVFRDAFGLL
jgi:hypothetical protein